MTIEIGLRGFFPTISCARNICFLEILSLIKKKMVLGNIGSLAKFTSKIDLICTCGYFNNDIDPVLKNNYNAIGIIIMLVV
jgi:hypothetical protein